MIWCRDEDTRGPRFRALGIKSIGSRKDTRKKGAARAAVVLLFLVFSLLASFSPFSSFSLPTAAARGTILKTIEEEGYTWYFSEGCTRGGFEEWLTLFNPGSDELVVTVTYMVSEGATRERIYSLPSRTRLNVYVNQEIGSEHDVGMKVFSSGFFLAERSLYFNYNGEWAGGHSSWGTRTPSTRWYFAEGSTREDYQTWVCLLNPNDEECVVDLTFFCSNGEGIVHSARIPPDERYTVSVNDVVGADRDFFIQVDSELPVVAERPMYFNYLKAWPGGHDVLGAADLSTNWYFAQGTVGPGNDTWLCLANPGSDDAEVIVELFPGNGSTTSSRLTVPGYTRVTADLADLAGKPGDYAIHIESNVAVVAERSMYFCDEYGRAGGACATGSPATTRRYYLAEGSTRPGFETRLHLANFAGEPATATLTIYGSDGYSRAVDVVIPAASRTSLDLGELTGREDDVSCEVVADRDILVERSTFFLYHDLWPGGDATIAYPAP
jgi:hypothetical protein